jgi:hypothetical protein
MEMEAFTIHSVAVAMFDLVLAWPWPSHSLLMPQIRPKITTISALCDFGYQIHERLRTFS